MASASAASPRPSGRPVSRPSAVPPSSPRVIRLTPKGQGEADTRPDTTPDVPTDTVPSTPDAGASGGRDSQASRLVALALDLFRFVQGTDGRPYAVPAGGPNVAVPLRGDKGLRQRLAKEFYARTSTTPGGTALADALTVIEGRASDEPEVPIWLRVAPWRDGFVLDLGEPSGRAVVVRPGAWHLAESSPVLFRRTALTGALPLPAAPGAGTAGLLGLRQLLNVDDASFRLIVGWLLAALWPDIPHPILALLGEQGTAKSTAARLAVRMVNPSASPLTTPPKDIGQWAVTAAASWTVALDNLSTIPAWFSDTLCKAVTGDGIVTRTLYSNDDVTVQTFRRVIALTSIDAGALAGDLAERMIPVELQVIPRDARRPEAEIEAAFAAAHPVALAAVLDLANAALAAPPHVRLAELPRMADFARLLAALDTVTNWTTLADYLACTSETNTAVLEADPFATAVLSLLRGQAVGWHGTAGDLLEALTQHAPDPLPRRWPGSPRAASGHLRRIAPALRTAGAEVETVRTHAGRLIRLALTDDARTANPSDPTVTTDATDALTL